MKARDPWSVVDFVFRCNEELTRHMYDVKQVEQESTMEQEHDKSTIDWASFCGIASWQYDVYSSSYGFWERPAHQKMMESISCIKNLTRNMSKLLYS